MIVIKVNYTTDQPIIKVNYDDSPIYISTTVDATYIKVDYGTGGGSGGAIWGDIIGNLSDQLDLQAALDDKVPYTGATANVDLGEYELKAGQIELDQSPTGTAGVAVTRWNDTIGSTETTLKGGNVVLKNGVDLVARVVNKVTPNTTLTKAAYQAVKVSGAQGQRLAIALAQANNDNNSADTLGLVIETIPTNQEGFIMTVGSLEGINTTGSLQGETWSDGDVLYLSPTTAGAITNIKPNGSTGHIVVIGYVEYAHANNGKIYVKIMNGWELDELHNVFISSPANNDALIYESATSLWKNKTIATALGYTPVPSTRSLTINGTAYDLTADRTWSVGTVTSVALSVPTGLVVTSGSPITTSGTIAVGLQSGYSIPTTVKQGNWDDAYTFVSAFPSQTGNSGKYLTTDGSTLSWGTVSTANIYNSDGTLTGNRTVTSGGYNLTFTGSNTAASGTARFIQMTPTISASANNDTLVGLFVNPTFNTGAFTGANNISAEIRNGKLVVNASTSNFAAGDVEITSGNRYSPIVISQSSTGFRGVVVGTSNHFAFGYGGGSAPSPLANKSLLMSIGGSDILITQGLASQPSASDVTMQMFGATKNITIGGTVDAGYTFDVQGTGRFTGKLLTTSAEDDFGGTSNYVRRNSNNLWFYSSTVSQGGIGSATGTNHRSILLQGVYSGYSADAVYIGTSTTAGTYFQNTYMKIGGLPTTYTATAILELESITRGFLQPRMTTTQRDAITTPATGLSIYNTTTNTIDYYNGTAWVSTQSAITNPITGTGASGQVAYWSGTNTQTGSNNLFWDSVNGRLGIGTNAPGQEFTLVKSSGSGGFGIFNEANANGNILLQKNNTPGVNDGFVIQFNRSDGTINIPTNIDNNRGLGTIQYFGFHTSSYRYAGAFRAAADGSISSTSMPMRFEFLTSTEGTTSPTVKMMLKNNGNLILQNGGTFTDGGQRLQVNGTALFTGSVTGTGNSSTYTVTASSGVARSKSITSTLVAAANNDVLVGLDIAPTFTNGAFTGVSNLGLRVTNADTILRGSGNTSATNALTVQNSSGNTTFNISNDSSAALTTITGSTSSGIRIAQTTTQRQIQISSVSTSGEFFCGSAITDYTFFNNGGFALLKINTAPLPTTGGDIVEIPRITQGFAPTSGTATLSLLHMRPVINQTGGANGITRGLYVNPTLTAAADWRSIEWSNNSGWGLYGDGSANNFLRGSLGIGSTSLTGYNLRITRNLTGATSVYGVSVTSTIQSGVTGDAVMYQSFPSTTAATFTTYVSHFYAQAAFNGAGSTIQEEYGFRAAIGTYSATAFGFLGAVASGTGKWNLYMSGTAANYLNGNLLIGTTTDGGQKLQVNGDTLMKGSGNTSATNGLSVQDSGGTNNLRVRNDGVITLRAFIGSFGLNIYGDSTAAVLLDQTITSGTSISAFKHYVDNARTSGTFNRWLYQGNFNPTSGTAIENALNLNITINQTGGANGITRGLYINPTLTSAADWRAIEAVSASNANHTLLKLRNATVDVFTVKADSKIGFYNATPVAQPTTAIAEAAFVENGGGTAVNVDSTFAGYTLQQIAQALKDLGILA